MIEWGIGVGLMAAMAWDGPAGVAGGVVEGFPRYLLGVTWWPSGGV